MSNAVLSFGEALIDFHQDEQNHPSVQPMFAAHPGGAPANVAVAIARLGAQATFVGMLSTDRFGDLLWEQMSEAGVNLSYVLRTAQARTALAFVDHDSTGERHFTFYRPPSADLLFRAQHFRSEAFTETAIFHACSNSLTEDGIANATLSGMLRARISGSLVSFDINFRPALWKPHEDPMPKLLEALAIADLVKLNAEEFQYVSGRVGGDDVFVDLLWSHAPRMLVVTDGPRPIRWFTRETSGSLPSLPVMPVDSTGAGDAFMGGLLYRLVTANGSANELTAMIENPIYRDDVLRFASACGAATATQVGSFAAMPSLEVVESLLTKRT